MATGITHGAMPWRAAAEVLPAIVAEIETSGRVLFVNRCFSAYTGHPREAVAEFSWHNIIHPDDFPSAIEGLARGFAREQPFDIRFRLRRADGTYRTFQGWGAPYRGPDGKIDGWIAVALDVEESVETLRLLHDSELRLQQFLETLPIIVWTADANGWIDWYNPRWYEFTGQTREEAAGWGWQAAHHPEDFPRVMEAWPRSIATGEPFEMEFRMRRHDGE
jgi:PAS domain S-box-containing protein